MLSLKSGDYRDTLWLTMGNIVPVPECEGAALLLWSQVVRRALGPYRDLRGLHDTLRSTESPVAGDLDPLYPMMFSNVCRDPTKLGEIQCRHGPRWEIVEFVVPSPAIGHSFTSFLPSIAELASSAK